MANVELLLDTKIKDLYAQMGKEYSDNQASKIRETLLKKLTPKQVIGACDDVAEKWDKFSLPKPADIIAAAPIGNGYGDWVPVECSKCTDNSGWVEVKNEKEPWKSPAMYRCSCENGRRLSSAFKSHDDVFKERHNYGG